MFKTEIEISKHDFTEEKELYILPVGDLHIGATTSYWQEAVTKIDQLCKQYPKLKLIGVGDYGDNATQYSRASTYDNVMTPQEQLRAFQESFLKRYKDRWLHVVSGNHEFNRLERDAGINPIQEACFNLDIPFSKATGLIDINLGKRKKQNGRDIGVNYLIQVTHGASAARTKGGQHQAAVRTARKISNADVYISGHTHYPSNGHAGRLEYDKKNKTLRHVNQLIMTSTSWMGYELYADRKNYEPTGYALQILKLYNFATHNGYKKGIELISKGGLE